MQILIYEDEMYLQSTFKILDFMWHFGTLQKKNDDILGLKIDNFVRNGWNVDIYYCNC